MKLTKGKYLFVVLCFALTASTVNAAMIAGFNMDGNTSNVTGNAYYDMNLGGSAAYDPSTPLGGVGNQSLDMSFSVNDSAYYGYGSPQPDFGFTNNGAWTIMTWFKTQATTTSQIVSRRKAATGNGWTLSHSSGGAAYLFVQGSTAPNGRIAIGGSGLNDGEWHHLVGVYDPFSDLDGNGDGEIFLYIDGSLAATDVKTQPEAIDYGNSNVRIGGGFDMSTGFYNNFSGSVDDVAVFNHALDSTEVTYFYLNVIPEPATLTLLGIGGLVAMIRRRK